MAEAPAVWQSVGRGTQAGRALFNLFSDDVNGRKSGDKFSARNKAVLEAKIAMGWRPDLPGYTGKPLGGSPAKPTVCVPKFKKATASNKPCAAASGKKSADIILKELALRQQEMEQHRQPPPQGPLLDDVEKERLAEWMRYRGKPPEQKPRPPSQHKLKAGSKAELQGLFDQIVIEVNERQQYLEDLAGFASSKDYQAVSNQVKRDIQDRVQDMKRLDQLIKANHQA